ncbi:MAG: 50S ribosomal protein L10 [Candidatus Omnitrophica bacterium]|nr:50S ribosomal protein L10 [Candidatus Omnitrophota bacterium]
MKVGQLYRQRIADTVKDGVTKKSNTFLVSWCGVSSAKMGSLRKDLKRKKADVLISKTSVARIALKNSNYENLAKRLNGQTAFVLSDTDASEVSRILVKFAKDCEGFIVQGGLFNGDVISPEQVKTLSDLPPREVLLAKFIGTLQAPVTRFAGALNTKTRNFILILKQKSDSDATSKSS